MRARDHDLSSSSSREQQKNRARREGRLRSCEERPARAAAASWEQAEEANRRPAGTALACPSDSALVVAIAMSPAPLSPI